MSDSIEDDDIKPSSNKDSALPELNTLLMELMDSGGRKIYFWEVLIIYPVCNQVQVLERGIREAVNSKNYVCAASLLRSLMESAMSLVYALSIPKDNEAEFYDQFVQYGRLRRYSKSKKKWETVRDEHLITQFEKVTGIETKAAYNELCNILHFSIRHMQMLGQISDDESRQLAMKISKDGPDAPEGSYDHILQLTDGLLQVVKRYVAAEIHYKKSQHGEEPSELAQKVVSLDRIKNGKK